MKGRLWLVLVVAVAALGGAQPSAAGARAQSLVACYFITTHIVSDDFTDALNGNLCIDTFRPSTGSITGHAVAEGVTYAMRGTVSGTSITMRVWIAGEAPILSRGTISRDGTISGAFKQLLDGSGTWTMTRLETTVLVRQRGWSEEFQGHQLTWFSWGVVLKNPSMSYDARNVEVEVEALGSDGKVIPDQGRLGSTLPVIPAGQDFYLGGDTDLFGVVPIRGLRVLINVGSTPTARYGLPLVSDVRVDAAAEKITATVMNPYKTAISPFDYEANVVVYDRAGRVIGGGDLGMIGNPDTFAPIKSGELAPLSLSTSLLASHRDAWRPLGSPCRPCDWLGELAATAANEARLPRAQSRLA